jgi:hypothetical protein
MMLNVHLQALVFLLQLRLVRSRLDACRQSQWKTHWLPVELQQQDQAERAAAAQEVGKLARQGG